VSEREERQLLERLEQGKKTTLALRAEIGKVIVGHESTLDGVVTALFAGGNVLLEGVPGLGKTLLVSTLARTLGLDFKRVQCTPDLMPADILGTRMLVEEPGGGRRFEFQPGPVFTQVLLADEINRATPKTQSALLEAMQERAVTVAGERRELGDPFLVLATQNPIEMEGTFPLPEAQLDRFMFKLLVEPPTVEQLGAIVDRTTGNVEDEVKTVVQADEIRSFKHAAREVLLPEAVKRFALELVDATHPERPSAPEAVRKWVRYGASPRAAQALVLAAKIFAAMDGRPNAGFDDVKWAALPVLRHRVVLSFEGEAEGASGDTVATQVIEAVSAKLERTLAGT
jgi:MoxR-like ATPase